MSDFRQAGPITTLHLLSERNVVAVEEEIYKASELRPISLVLPCLVSEMDGPALSVITSVLQSVEYLREIVVTLGPASEAEFLKACEYFKPLKTVRRKVRIIWSDGPRIQSLLKEIEDLGLIVGPHGKGRSAWLAYGYIVAEAKSYIIALHDCDIVSYTRNMLNRLVYPTVIPNLDYEFCKGYYCRVTDRMHGRVMRLLVTPLLRAFTRILGELPILEYFNSFRYVLSGEFSMVADLARVNRIPPDWGLEVGVLFEVYRNCSLSRICQSELCLNYDHKHQHLSSDDPEKGLNKMAVDVCSTFFRALASTGLVFTEAFFRTLRVTYLKEAQDLMAMYHADALINGLDYDRHEEATAFETFAQAITIAGNNSKQDPLGIPLIPNWNRVFSAIPGCSDKLVNLVDEDNKRYFW